MYILHFYVNKCDDTAVDKLVYMYTTVKDPSWNIKLDRSVRYTYIEEPGRPSPIQYPNYIRRTSIISLMKQLYIVTYKSSWFF